jgi:hypothetical protein
MLLMLIDVLLLGFICAILAPGRPSCKTAVQTLRSYTRGSVRRASGFVLTGYSETIRLIVTSKASDGI